MRRLVALFALALACAGSNPARGQIFYFLAFGDSITRGFGDNEPKPAGYPKDLADASRLDCDFLKSITEGESDGTVAPGATCAIVNEGCAGEKTGVPSSLLGGCTTASPGGVTRIDSELATKPYDVVLLMEGTNDIGAVSTSTIACNLAVMDRKAALAAADTVHGSIVRQRLVASNTEENAGAVSALRNLVQSLAAARNRTFVDTWNVLCPAGLDADGHNQTNCFANHYFDNRHPDETGYMMMADEYDAVISATAVPAAPAPTSPAGEVCAADLIGYDWDQETGGGATWYEVEVSNGGTFYDEWWQEIGWTEADTSCTGQPAVTVGGVCTLTTGGSCSLDADEVDGNEAGTLAAGDYSWRVRGRNPLGWGSWSADTAFSLATAAPATAAPGTPAGAYAPPTPTFTWPEVAGASGYDLQVDDSNPTTVIDESYDSSICAAGTCSVSPGGVLPDGDYAWRVRATNACGGAFSGDQSFSVGVGPAAPSTPGSEILDPTPTYRWSAAANATSYVIEVSDGSLFPLSPAPPYLAGSVCAGASCAVTLTSPSLPPGAYSWRVRGSHAGGDGPWSAFVPFSVATCDPTDPLPLENHTVSAPEAPVRGCGEVRAGNLGGGAYAVGTGGAITLHAGAKVVLFNGFSVESGGEVVLTADPN